MASSQPERDDRAGGGGVWTWRAAAGVMELSTEWKRQLGFAADELGNTWATWAERIYSRDRVALTSAVEGMAHAGEGRLRADVRLVHKEGGVVVVTTEATALRAADGSVHVVGMNVVSEGMTEELELSTGHETSVMSWSAETDGRGTWFNRSWVEFTGRSSEDQAGEGWFSGVHPDDRDGWIQAFRDAAAGAGFTREYRLRHRDGSYRWILETVTPRRDAAGRVSGYTGSGMDISDRKEHEERLRLAIEASPTAMIMANPQGRMVLVNANAERLFGYSREELVGNSVEMLVPPDVRGEHPGYRRGFYAHPQVRPMGVGRDLYGQRKDGSMVPVEIGLNPIDTGQGVYVLSSIVDISERKKAERALRESEARLAGVIDSAMDAIITIDSQQRIVLFNSAAERMFRCGSEEAIGRTLERFIPSRFRSGHREHIEGFAKTGTTSRRMGSLGELTAIRSDGEEFPIEASISQVVSEGERLFTVIMRDITERLKSEAAIRESEERYRSVSELTSDFAYGARVSEDGRLTTEWVTGALVTISGYTAQELEQRGGWGAIVVPEDAVLFEEQVRRILSGATVSAEFRLASQQGGIRWIRHRGRPVIEPGTDRVGRIVGAAQDITERKDAERRQAIMMAELDHRVKNNLSLVLSMAARTSETARTMEEFNESFSGRLRALARVHGTLALARWEGANLRELTRRTLEVHAGEGSEQFEIEGEDYVLPAWQAQPMGLVLHELATNAVKYGALSSPAGRIKVRWEVAGGMKGVRMLRIRWQEAGGPAVVAPTSRGFGTLMIERGVAYELRGQAKLDFRAEGVSCEIMTPFASGLSTVGEGAGRGAP